MMKQFLEIKEAHPEDIVFFRMGDFYEMFFEDAQRAAEILDITLTARDGGNDVKVPMAGVPYHAAEGYIQTLVEAGYRVAICEQMSDPAQAKGLVEREVVRIVTPGARMDAGVMESKQDNFAAALAGTTRHIGLAVADISTGYFACVEVRGQNALEKILSECARLGVIECCLGPELAAPLHEPLADLGVVNFPDVASYLFDEKEARDRLKQHFEVVDLAGFGCDDKPAAVTAAGVLLEYLRETQRGAVGSLTTLRTYHLEDALLIDPVARRTLEVTQPLFPDRRGDTLLDTMDRTRTPMGGRMLRRWMERPLVEVDAIRARLDLVDVLVWDSLRREQLQDAFRDITDLERLIGRVAYGSANPRDLGALGRSLGRLPAIYDIMADGPDEGLWVELQNRLDPLEDVAEAIQRALMEEPPTTLREGGIIRDGYDESIDQLRARAREGREWVVGLETWERERTGIKSLKVRFNKVFGYYIEVTHANRDRVPEDYIRKQTLVNSERYITPELKEREADILNSQERLSDLEYKAFIELRTWLSQHAARIQATADVLAQLDVFVSLAQVAVRNRYCYPTISTDRTIQIKEGRHAVLEVSDIGEPFVANDCFLNEIDHAFLLITGPNMSGKSTYLRQVALIVILAQMGSFVPATSAHIGIVDQIFTRIGAADDLARGRSTFMVEMTEVAAILNNATDRSLLILDEVGRGTSTYDGISIAWATCEYLRTAPHLGSRTLFATHYHELTQLADYCTGIVNYSVAVREEGEHVVFLRKVVPGPTDQSYGIHVARLAGLPRSVVHRAWELLENLEATSALPSPGEPKDRGFYQASLFPVENEEDGP